MLGAAGFGQVQINRRSLSIFQISAGGKTGGGILASQYQMVTIGIATIVDDGGVNPRFFRQGIDRLGHADQRVV